MKLPSWLRIGRKQRSINQVLADFAAISGTAAQIRITPEKALSCATVFAIVRALVVGLSRLPIQVKRQVSEDETEDLPGHPLTKLFARPNGWQSKTDYIAFQTTNVLLWGNHYVHKATGRSGNVRILTPLPPQSVQVEQKEDLSLVYKVQLSEGMKEYGQNEIHHIRSPISTDGFVGRSPVELAAEAIALAIAAEEFGATFFASSGLPYSVIKRPGHFETDEAWQRLKNDWLKATERRGARGPMILEDGWDFVPVNINAKEAQLLELRKHQREELAGAFGVPAHKIGALERATFSNIEQQALEFVQDSLQWYIEQYEDAIERDLMTEEERASGIFVKFNLDAILRGDFKSRQEGLQIQRLNGIINANEWREIEDRNPREDEGGNEYIVPMNMGPQDDGNGDAGNGDEGGEGGEGDDDDEGEDGE